METEKKLIFSTYISIGGFQDFIDRIATLPEKKESSYVCFANVHMIIECHKSSEICTAVNKADLVAPDGKPLSVFLNLFHGLRQDKVSGPDVFPKILKEAAAAGKKVFFFGSTSTVLKKVMMRALAEYPDLKIVGSYSPPFRKMTARENKIIIKTINRAGPQFVFVALGCPKQEEWMAANQGKIQACMLGVGQAFQVYAKELKRAPQILQNLGFEWAYRLTLEPGRLWKRYLQTNSMFLFLTLKYGVRNILQKHPVRD